MPLWVHALICDDDAKEGGFFIQNNDKIMEIWNNDKKNQRMKAEK